MTPEELIQHRIVTLVVLLQRVRGPRKIDLAHALGIDAGALSHRLQTGKRKSSFKAHEIVLLALHYDLSTDVFLMKCPERQALLEELGREAVSKAR